MYTVLILIFLYYICPGPLRALTEIIDSWKYITVRESNCKCCIFRKKKSPKIKLYFARYTLIKAFVTDVTSAAFSLHDPYWIPVPSEAPALRLLAHTGRWHSHHTSLQKYTATERKITAWLQILQLHWRWRKGKKRGVLWRSQSALEMSALFPSPWQGALF